MTAVKNTLSIVVAALTMLFGNNSLDMKLLWALVFFMALDFLMGIHDAKVKKTFCRRELLNGAWRKFIMLAMILVAHQIEESTILGDITVLQTGVTVYLIVYELVSIMSHITFAGVPIPTMLSNAIKDAATKNGIDTTNTGEDSGDTKK